MTTTIDLRTYVEPLSAFVRDAVAKFAAEKPDVPAATIGLWGDGFHGGVALHVDTPEHRDDHVAKWRERPVGILDQDARGLFGVNGWDFPHWLGEWSFPEWPNLYEIPSEEIAYVTLQGEHLKLDAEAANLEKNAAIIPLLVVAMRRQGDFSALDRVAPFRAGMQTIDGISEYWLIDVESSS